ncbi:MAG: hypothetical protein LC643_04425 [Bacteroidales bacterium]|nr:hypothetical protein [Bacteroidales bacterium]
MKTTILHKSGHSDADIPADALSQLRSIKQAGAFLLLLFASLIFALFMSSCGDDDKNEEDLDLWGDNTTLTVSGEVDGNFQARGEYIEVFNNQTQVFMGSFYFYENEDDDESQFLINITRYANSSVELSEQVYSIDNAFNDGEEMDGFGAVVMWRSNDESDDYDTIYSSSENSTIKIEKVTSAQITGEFTLNMTALGYDENPSTLTIRGSFKVPRVKI